MFTIDLGNVRICQIFRADHFRFDSLLSENGTNMAQGAFADLVNIAWSRVISGAIIGTK